MSDPEQPQADEHVGHSIGPYRVESLLGVGGMGRVYKAAGPEGDDVALKLVKTDLAGDEIFRRRFDREVRIARTVVHLHVVPVIDAGEHDGIPYMVQKYVGNGTLEDLLKKQQSLDIETTLKITTQVAAGLDALCAAGLVHRDVKPANILLDTEGTAYITDFGLAKDSQGSVLTRPGQALGSLDYMAPEQIRGEQVGAASDVYALGCVVHECLSGAPPFADRQGMRVLWAHLQDAPVDPCARRADVPPAMGQLVLRALDKEPQNRPQTAGEFAQMLRAAAGAAAPPTGPDA